MDIDTAIERYSPYSKHSPILVRLLGSDVLYEVAKIRADLAIKTHWLTSEASPWKLS